MSNLDEALLAVTRVLAALESARGHISELESHVRNLLDQKCVLEKQISTLMADRLDLENEILELREKLKNQ